MKFTFNEEKKCKLALGACIHASLCSDVRNFSVCTVFLHLCVVFFSRYKSIIQISRSCRSAEQIRVGFSLPMICILKYIFDTPGMHCR